MADELQNASAAKARAAELVAGLDLEGSSAGDFDFLHGRWVIHHRRLAERMAGAVEWSEFDTCFDCRPLLGGMANVDRCWTNPGKDYFEGDSVRTFDAATKLWTIYWMDTSNPALTEQVKGAMQGARGAFYGVEPYQGGLYVMRFLWTINQDGSALWEEAFEDPSDGTWETNWTMAFTRSETSGGPPG